MLIGDNFVEYPNKVKVVLLLKIDLYTFILMHSLPLIKAYIYPLSLFTMN